MKCPVCQQVAIPLGTTFMGRAWLCPTGGTFESNHDHSIYRLPEPHPTLATTESLPTFTMEQVEEAYWKACGGRISYDDMPWYSIKHNLRVLFDGQGGGKG